MNDNLTIQQAIDRYLNSVRLSRSANTARTYCNAMQLFITVLTVHQVDPEQEPITKLGEEPVVWMTTALKDNWFFTQFCNGLLLRVDLVDP